MKKIILICTTLLLVLAGCRKELNENQTEQTEQTEQQQISDTFSFYEKCRNTKPSFKSRCFCRYDIKIDIYAINQIRPKP